MKTKNKSRVRKKRLYTRETLNTFQSNNWNKGNRPAWHIYKKSNTCALDLGDNLPYTDIKLHAGTDLKLISSFIGKLVNKFYSKGINVTVEGHKEIIQLVRVFGEKMSDLYEPL